MNLDWGSSCSHYAWDYGEGLIRAFHTDLYPPLEMIPKGSGYTIRPMYSVSRREYQILLDCMADGKACYRVPFSRRDGPLYRISLERGDIGSIISQDDVASLLEQYKGIYDTDDLASEFLAQYGRYRENLVRAASRIEEFGLCNRWCFFGTITISPENGRRDDLGDIYQRFCRDYIRNKRDYLRKFCKRKNLSLDDADFMYLIVPELHADGVSYHLHGLFDIGDTWADDFTDYSSEIGKRKLPKYIKENAFEPGKLFYSPDIEKKFGWNVFEIIRDKRAAVRYLLKYIRKGMKNVSQKVDSGKNLYWHSQGLKKKIPLDVWAVERAEDGSPAGWILENRRAKEHSCSEWYHVNGDYAIPIGEE